MIDTSHTHLSEAYSVHRLTESSARFLSELYRSQADQAALRQQLLTPSSPLFSIGQPANDHDSSDNISRLSQDAKRLGAALFDLVKSAESRAQIAVALRRLTSSGFGGDAKQTLAQVEPEALSNISESTSHSPRGSISSTVENISQTPHQQTPHPIDQPSLKVKPQVVAEVVGRIDLLTVSPTYSQTARHPLNDEEMMRKIWQVKETIDPPESTQEIFLKQLLAHPPRIIDRQDLFNETFAHLQRWSDPHKLREWTAIGEKTRSLGLRYLGSLLTYLRRLNPHLRPLNAQGDGALSYCRKIS